jgi:enediyne biosynthesis protein E4
MSVTSVTTDGRMATSRRRWGPPLAFLCASGLFLGGRAWWFDRRYHSAMEEIESEVVEGRYAIACRKLDQLLSWQNDSNGEIAYLLGSCELARRRIQAAGEAWAQVLAGSLFSRKAIEGRMQLLQESGQLDAAEQFVNSEALDPRNDRTALLVLLVPMYRALGRIDEAESVIVDRWEHLNASGEGSLEPAIKLVLQHIELTVQPMPVETARAFLEQASKLAPLDDRVWLGQANLAIRTGAHDEAQRWLDACQQRRPLDVPVWRARLRWGISTNRVDVVKEALTYMPAKESNSAESHWWNAWLARHRGNVATERHELELLASADPTDLNALGRLAELAGDLDQPARAARLASQRTEIDRQLASYLKLYERKQPFRDAIELARLAERLGRRFEARAFLTIALSETPAREDLRQQLARLSEKPAASAVPGH